MEKRESLCVHVRVCARLHVRPTPCVRRAPDKVCVCVCLFTQVMWLMYEVPETRFEGLAMRFMDIRKRVYAVPELGSKAMMVSVVGTCFRGHPTRS